MVRSKDACRVLCKIHGNNNSNNCYEQLNVYINNLKQRWIERDSMTFVYVIKSK